ncbi:MAG: bifunctional glutamate N-acetyltransferase/amino-acid acetyltransferase ArgJ [Gammaproteobacteria bacterium]
MAVNLMPPSELLPIAGMRLAAVAAGIRYRERPDLAVIEASRGSRVAAVFTRNAFCAAPIIIARRHLAACAPRYLLINAGNANAGTGAPGLEDALTACEALATRTGCRRDEVLPFSTGVIGERLPVARLTDAIPTALAGLAPDGWVRAAAAIMTTDTVIKGASREAAIAGRRIAITGIAKGAGMIRPDMATMLAFIATDAGISKPTLDAMLRSAIDASFNCITVDGDTSTNDACVLTATGKSGVDVDTDSACAQFQAALNEVAIELAQAIVRDGEGATKFITVEIRGAASADEARRTAFTIAHSPLVKTAFFASDPNWGRILAAVGRAGIERLVVERVEVFLDDLCVARQGAVADDYIEAAGRQVMRQLEIAVTVNLHRGRETLRVWTSDLSYDYVRINAEYRS